MSESPLSCKFHLKVERPLEAVFQAVQKASHLQGFFATGGASGDLEPGVTVEWAFHDFPGGPFPVKVLEVVPFERIHLQWESGMENGWNDVVMEFQALDDPNLTLVTVTESGWPRTDIGIEKCIENSGGWANMLDCLKVYLELGVNLRRVMF